MPPSKERFRRTFGQLNPGKMKAKDAVEFFVDHGLTACTLQEMSDRSDIYTAFVRAGLQPVRQSVKPGQAAMMTVSAGLHYLRTRYVPLYHGGDIGPGTGPDEGKPKWLQVTKYYDPILRRHLVIGNIHCYAGQKWPKYPENPGNQRGQISRDMVAKSGGVLDNYAAPTFLMGDFNAVINSPTMAPLWNDRWTSTHHLGGPMPTHGDWTPDHICWLGYDSRIIFISQHAYNVGSDHRGMIGAFDISVGHATPPRKPHSLMA